MPRPKPRSSKPIGFPSSPTARCVELSLFERIIALAGEHGICTVHDLAYADICFDGCVAPSILQVPGAREVAVQLFTLSKSYNMAGWRIGLMAGNRELLAALAQLRDVHAYRRSRPSRRQTTWPPLRKRWGLFT